MTDESLRCCDCVGLGTASACWYCCGSNSLRNEPIKHHPGCQQLMCLHCIMHIILTYQSHQPIALRSIQPCGALSSGGMGVATSMLPTSLSSRDLCTSKSLHAWLHLERTHIIMTVKPHSVLGRSSSRDKWLNTL